MIYAIASKKKKTKNIYNKIYKMDADSNKRKETQFLNVQKKVIWSTWLKSITTLLSAKNRQS